MKNILKIYFLNKYIAFKRPDLMVKKLRFYARFIVVCLLLRKSKQVRDLIRELGRQIDDYVKIYDPEDQLEWQLVKNEINDFIEADSVLTVDGGDIAIAAGKYSSSNRLVPSEVPQIAANPQLLLHADNLNLSPTTGIISSHGHHQHHNHLSLQEILIVGNCNDQV